jgi:hypothetical protein
MLHVWANMGRQEAATAAAAAAATLAEAPALAAARAAEQAAREQQQFEAGACLIGYLAGWRIFGCC